MERERESAKLLLFYTFFALLDPNTPKCKRANATVILLIMD
jgi:phage FluMu protein Com